MARKAKTQTHRGAVAVVLTGILVLSTTACGARWTDEQRAEVVTRGQATGAQPAASAQATRAAGGAPSGATPSSGAAGGGGPAGAAPAAEGQPAAADPAAPAAAGGGPLACAAPSDAPGVTADKLAVGSISSLSGPVPGLGASAAAAVRAYVAYRNATGGVCGRQIELHEVDDGTDAGRYRSAVTDLSSQVLGIAGGFAIGDGGAIDIIEQQKLPVVNVPSTDAVTAAPTVFDMNPPFENPNGVIGKYKYLYDQGAWKVSMVYLAVDQSRAEADKQRALMEAAGLQIVQVQELPLSTLSYDSAARGVANSGADYMFFIADAHGNVSMARSMADAGAELKFSEYFTFVYGTDFIDAAGDASEGAISWLRVLPNEDAGSNPELSAYLDWMGRTAPDEPLDEFAADSWAGAKAFFDSLEALPGPISRDALVAQLDATDTFDAGGMLGPIRLGAELTNACEVAMQVQSGTWKRLTPDQGFLC